jgi:hypothetical protein
MGWLDDNTVELNCELFLNEFLLESNYGALEKDERIHNISMTIKDDMIRKIGIYPKLRKEFEDIVFIDIDTKYKKVETKKLTLAWKLVLDTIYDYESKIPFHNAWYDKVEDDFYKICFFMHPVYIRSIRDLKDKIRDQIDFHLYHEVKHILDEIDGIYTKPKYIYPSESKSGYLKQDQEFHNFIITVIKELQQFKKEDPSLTFEQALDKSRYYPKIKIHLDKSKLLNKFRSKVADFWIKHFV